MIQFVPHSFSIKILLYYYKIFDYNVKFTGELKISYSYVALSLIVLIYCHWMGQD